MDAEVSRCPCSRIVMCTVSNSVHNTMLAVAYNKYGNTYGDAVGVIIIIASGRVTTMRASSGLYLVCSPERL
jgi:hypothetical protein